MAAGLVAKAARLAHGWPKATEVVERAEALRSRLATLALADADAYAKVIEALRLPSDSPSRAAEVAGALSGAAEVPLAIAEAASEVAMLAALVAQEGNDRLRGDAVVAAELAEAGARRRSRRVSSVPQRSARSSRTSCLRQRHDDLCVGAVGLPLPGLRDPLEGVGLDVEDNLTSGSVADEAQVLLAELVLGDREVGVAVELSHLAADRRRGQRHLCARRLADLDEAPAGRGGLDRGGRRRAPERVDDVGRAVAACCLLERPDKVVFLEVHGRVGPELGRALQTLGITADGDDALGAEEFRRLRDDEPDRARRGRGQGHR